MYEYAVTIKRVVDGDTVDVDIDLGSDLHNASVARPPRQGRTGGVDL